MTSPLPFGNWATFIRQESRQVVLTATDAGRDLVIAAKDRARWASRSDKVEKSKRAMKAEMVEWMLVWLDDPAMFPAWSARRRAVMGYTVQRYEHPLEHE